MYRVFLNATAESGRNEEWLEAVTIRESWAGHYWEFLDVDGQVVRRFRKAKVRRVEQAIDRRRPRPIRDPYPIQQRLVSASFPHRYLTVVPLEWIDAHPDYRWCIASNMAHLIGGPPVGHAVYVLTATWDKFVTQGRPPRAEVIDLTTARAASKQLSASGLNR